MYPFLELEHDREEEDEEADRGLGHGVECDGDVLERPVGEADVGSAGGAGGHNAPEEGRPVEHNASLVARAVHKVVDGAQHERRAELEHQVDHGDEERKVVDDEQVAVVEGEHNAEAVVDENGGGG